MAAVRLKAQAEERALLGQRTPIRSAHSRCWGATAHTLRLGLVAHVTEEAANIVSAEASGAWQSASLWALWHIIC